MRVLTDNNVFNLLVHSCCALGPFRTSISVCNQPATQSQLSLPSLRGR